MCARFLRFRRRWHRTLRLVGTGHPARSRRRQWQRGFARARQSPLDGLRLLPGVLQAARAQGSRRGHWDRHLRRLGEEGAVAQGAVGTQTLGAVIAQQGSQKLDRGLGGALRAQRVPRGGFRMGAAGDLHHLTRQRPGLFRYAQLTTDAEEHIPCVRAGHQRSPEDQLSQSATRRPEIHALISTATQKEFRGAVPAGPDVAGDFSRGTRLPKITELHGGSTRALHATYQDILWLHVAMYQVGCVHRSQGHHEASRSPSHLTLLEPAGGRGNAMMQAALNVLEDQKEFSTMTHRFQQLHQMTTVSHLCRGTHLW
mmetsp:Transcript_88308/g.140468  ORF Transcript_88308/g.140468 Transcript_88308/m.140468 type:complete len:313 (-) Transcript_88308:227-1165(-)